MRVNSISVLNNNKMVNAGLRNSRKPSLDRVGNLNNSSNVAFEGRSAKGILLGLTMLVSIGAAFLSSCKKTPIVGPVSPADTTVVAKEMTPLEKVFSSLAPDMFAVDSAKANKLDSLLMEDTGSGGFSSLKVLRNISTPDTLKTIETSYYGDMTPTGFSRVKYYVNKEGHLIQEALDDDDVIPSVVEYIRQKSGGVGKKFRNTMDYVFRRISRDTVEVKFLPENSVHGYLIKAAETFVK